MASDSVTHVDDNSSTTTAAASGHQQGLIVNGNSAVKDTHHEISDEDDLPLVCVSHP